MPEGWEIGLFVHFIGLFALGCGIAVEFTAFVMMRRSASVQELRVWAELGRIVVKVPIPAVASLILLLSGGYLVSEFDIEWSEGWILFSLLALIVAGGFGGAVITPRLRAVVGAAGPAADGAVPHDITGMLRDPVLLGAIAVNNLLTLGIVWNMVTKPGTAGALITLLVLGGIGAAAAYSQVERA